MEKQIIYCWFGKKEKPDSVINCINTWKQNMPDWKLIEINENNFDINYNEFVKSAYNNKAWAFVSDVARLWALYEYGGIYMDTDVEVYKSLEEFTKHECFTGFENVQYPVTAVLGANKGNELIKELLDIYNTKTFELKQNWWEYETNTMLMSDIIGKYIDRTKNEYQESDKIVVYPRKYFTCNDNNEIDEQTYAKHLMTGSWVEK